MKKVIILNGPARSGKDTIADALVGTLFEANVPAVKVKFAGSLKDGVAAFMGLTDGERQFYFESPAKDVPHPRFFDMPPRQVLISFSEDWVKPSFGKKTFGEVLASRIKSSLYANYEVFVVSDGGFNEEVQGLKEVLGQEYEVKIIQLARSSTGFAGDSRGYIDNPYMRVDNDGTVDEAVSKIVREVFYGKQPSQGESRGA